MVSLRGLSFDYGSKTILKDVSLELRRGETLMITGPNGAGKSTLLRLLAGVLLPTSGSLEYDIPEGTDPRSIMAYLPDSLSFYRSMTPEEAADFHSGLFGTPPADMEMVRKAGVDMDMPISQLSMGQRILVQLSIELSTGPDLILVDEVLHAVDPYLRGLLFRELIGVMEERDPTVVLVNLNFEEVANLVDRVIFLGSKGIVIDEPSDELRSKTMLVVAEKQPEGLSVVTGRRVLGIQQWVVYPLHGGELPDNASPMDMKGILGAFMEAEYEGQRTGTRGSA